MRPMASLTSRLRLPPRLRRVVAGRWFPHASLFAVALALRVAWVLSVRRRGEWAFNDALLYHSNAVAVAEGRGYDPFGFGPTAQWPPGYSTVLAGIYRTFGVHPVLGELFNALTGAATVVLLVGLVARVADRRTAIVAGAMLAVLPGPILWTDVLVSETLYTFLFVVFVLMVVLARPTWRWMVLLGVVLGLGALVRGEALTWGLLPIVALWRAVPRRELLVRVAALAAVAIAVLSPWTIRNAIVMDAFVPVATNASQTLWSGHNPDATGGQVYPPDAYFDRFGDDVAARELAASEALRNDALEYLVTHPIRELELIPLKLVHLNRGDSYALDWVNDAPDGAPLSAAWVERIGVVADAGYYGLLTLTVLGALVLGGSFWRSRLGRVATTSFLTALVLYGFLYYGNYRYRLPYEPLMVAVAAELLTRVWDRAREPAT